MVCIVSMISDIIVGISAIVIAVVAFKGINTWRKELTGRAIFESAKKMMDLVYKVVDGYQWTVGLMTYSTESIDRPHQPNESDAVKQALDEWYAKSKRLEPVTQNYNDLAEVNWEVRTILGQEATGKIAELLAEIKKEIVNLSSAIYEYFDISKREAESGKPDRNAEFREKMHHIVYQVPDSEEIKKLNTLVTDLDKELAPYLRVRKAK